MEEVHFNGEVEREKVAAEGPGYVAYQPEMVKMITQGGSKPPLCNVGDGMAPPHLYTLSNGSIKSYVFLKLVEEHEDWTVETPLAMCRYVKPEGDFIFNIQACEDAVQENARRRLHNQFVVDIFREFMPLYDCGASANRMTEPQPPPDFKQERKDKIEALKSDKLGSTQKAIEYLSKYEIYCGRDFKFDEAFEKASSVCFTETIKEKQAKGKVRVRLEGRKPCWWDGVSPTDESGCRVKFARGDGHTFLTPDVRVVKDDPPTDIIVIPNEVEVGDKGELIVPGDTHVNPFAALFPPHRRGHTPEGLAYPFASNDQESVVVVVEDEDEDVDNKITTPPNSHNDDDDSASMFLTDDEDDTGSLP
jgi:hypothetical protein